MISLVIRAALSMGILLVLTSVLLFLIVKPGSSQFVVTIINLIMGGVMIGVAIPLARRQSRRMSPKENQ
ncbi:hypothetical protein SAMN04489812_0086 [Microlunatus soli]|uniref:Uncharacterized protein n=1 Tax=Microlunatus soli TaxID=630515 RepID=A0A1H1MEK7_9ACTN|nr:hypothetical protein SAMN04489812_0086 [Microlunatus soli]